MNSTNGDPKHLDMTQYNKQYGSMSCSPSISFRERPRSWLERCPLSRGPTTVKQRAVSVDCQMTLQKKNKKKNPSPKSKILSELLL